MGGQLSAWLAANRTEALGVGAVAVAGAALLARRRKATGAGGATTAGAVAPGTVPAASVVPGATADSSAFDAYNALQDEIGTLARNSDAARNTGAGGSGVGAAVGAPIASTLFAPTGNGQYVRFGNAVAEVESDGSLFQFNPDQWSALSAAHGGIGQPYTQLSDKPTDEPSWYSTAGNLARINPATSGA